MPEAKQANGIAVRWVVPLLISVAAAALGAGQWAGRSDVQGQNLAGAISDLSREIRADLRRMDDKLDSALERLARLEGATAARSSP